MILRLVFSDFFQKKDIIKILREYGVEAGELIQYVIPEMKPYQKYNSNEKFTNSNHASLLNINLPVHFGVDEKILKKIVDLINSY